MRKIVLTGFILAVISAQTFAVRPFITDDAAVTGHRQFQLETWTLFDRNASEHWMMWGYGPLENLEVAIGLLWGHDRVNNRLSLAAPLLEAKYLFRPYESGRGPGLAISAGTFLPFGSGDFQEDYWGAYSIFILTQALGRDESILIHGNLGMNFLNTTNRREHWTPFWGLGTQIRTFGGLHLVGEIISGDPYVPASGLAYHVGFRHFISDYFQVDLTFGDSLQRGEYALPFWFGFGVRLVFCPERRQARRM